MRITLGVTGGVAAYKAAELVRRLQQDGFSVQVVMTRGAREFITPLTFAALTGQKVITDLFAESGGEANLESAIEHIARGCSPGNERKYVESRRHARKCRNAARARRQDCRPRRRLSRLRHDRRGPARGAGSDRRRG